MTGSLLIPTLIQGTYEIFLGFFAMVIIFRLLMTFLMPDWLVSK